MILVLSLLLLVAGAVLRDVTLARQADQRDLWTARWIHVSTQSTARRDLGSTDVIARMVGDPTTPPEMLDELAMDLAANEWIPSDRLLDQLRSWARSQLMAERTISTHRSHHPREADQA